MPSPLRALILVRLSRVTDATTSPERQEDACREFCTRQGMTVVGVAEDLDVSGSTDPLDRDGSGPWLRDRLSEFDVVVAAKLDRYGRSTRHVYGLFDYLNGHGKRLLSADGVINTLGPAGELILFILSWAAQMELDAIKGRNRDSAQYSLNNGKYRGGIVPAGFRKAKHPDKGWTLVHDVGCDRPGKDGHDECSGTRCRNAMAPVIQEIVRRILDGESQSSIVKDLNGREVMTARDRQAELNDRPTVGHEWSVSNLGRIIASPTLIGQGTRTDENGREVPLIHNGEIVQRGEPLISASDYRALRAKLDERAPATRKIAEPSLLLGVLECECGKPMWMLRGGKRVRADGTRRSAVDRYRCASHTQGDRKSCGHPSFKAPDAEALAHALITDALGSAPDGTARPLIVREWVEGTSNGDVLADLNAQIEGIADDLPYLRGEQRQAARDMLDRLYARQDELEGQEDTPSGWVFRESDQSLRDYWEALDTPGRNALLREYGVEMTFGKSGVEVRLTNLPKAFGAVFENVARAATFEPDALRAFLAENYGRTEVTSA